jgi:hypothetical protein
MTRAKSPEAAESGPVQWYDVTTTIDGEEICGRYSIERISGYDWMTVNHRSGQLSRRMDDNSPLGLARLLLRELHGQEQQKRTSDK